MIDLGTLGGLLSVAYGINNSGQIVGYSLTAQGQEHAFLDSDGSMRDLGTLGGTRSEAFSVNERGQIVGSSSVAADVAFHGFLYSDGSMTDLNSLVDESGAGYLIHTGTSINNAGQIAAQAFNPNGETRAILLIPRRGVEKAKPHP